MSNLTITVEYSPGIMIVDIIKQMVDLANRMQIKVHCEINQIHVFVSPGDPPKKIYVNYNRASIQKLKYVSRFRPIGND